MKETFKMELKKEKEHLHIFVVINIKDILNMIYSMEMENIILVMETIIKGIYIKDISMVSVSIITLQVLIIKVIGYMVRKKVKDSFLHLHKHIMENGLII
jgi:hypothetical protein